MNELLLYAGGALPILWETSHLIPTRQVVRGFGNITRDNRLVPTMEWIAEAILLIFTGTLVIATTARFGAMRRFSPAAPTCSLRCWATRSFGTPATCWAGMGRDGRKNERSVGPVGRSSCGPDDGVLAARPSRSVVRWGAPP